MTPAPAAKRGLTIFFTGLSGAGKSTLASALLPVLQQASGRPVTVLDGDAVRGILSSELGFSREHRDLNVLRIGYVAAEISKHGGIVICAAIAPYAQARQQVRQMVCRSSRSMSRRRSLFANGGTPRACMPKRGPHSSTNLPALATRTNHPRIQKSSLIPTKPKTSASIDSIMGYLASRQCL